MTSVNKDMTVFDVIQLCEKTTDVFMQFGMHCFGCAFARGETVEQAAAAHGADSNELIKLLNECIANNA